MVFFHCDFCNVDCKTRKVFDKHIILPTHIQAVRTHKAELNSNIVNTVIPEHIDSSIVSPEQKKQEPIIMDHIDNLCVYCNKNYKHDSSLFRHNTVCVARKELIHMCNKAIIPLEIFEGFLYKLRVNPISLEFLKIKQDEKATQPISICNTTNNTTNTNTNTTHTNSHNNTNNTTNNNIVMIMPFGQEDLSMITDEMRKNIITRGHCAYEHLLNEIYKHPQNHNVFYGNKRNKMVKYLDTDHKLRVKKEKEIIEDIVSTNVDRLDSFVDDHIESLDTKQKKYAGILKDIHDDKVVKRKKKEDYAVQTQCKLDEITPECRTTVKGQASIQKD